ncbi:hypothetical protein [Chryseobacterium sp. YIM B08800]|uniref:hypothetical protein n=1 Tax=Chryseobacterium sp. YIM B08800 TaxID=2984136 RepID=UPI00223EB026|nr:hypothetical protein [Chryseobacterium sp. YIM B08800]
MKFKILLLLIFSFSFLSQFEAQRRTTSVKGYTRKDGTYVRPHTRSYNSGRSYSSSGSNYSSSYQSISDKNDSGSTTFSGDYLTSTSSYKGDKIEKSSLISTQNSDLETEDGNIIYLSVLYYKDKVIDICPISKNIFNSWTFDEINHSFNKNNLSSEDALDLVSNYGWSINKEKISKSFRFAMYDDKGLPNYLTKKMEAIKLKQP